MERRNAEETTEAIEVMETRTPPSTDSAEDMHKSSDLEMARTKSLVEYGVSPLREGLVVVLISLAQFMTQAALGETVVLVHIVGDHYNTNEGVLTWFIAGYSLTVGTFILISGRLGDLFGWKKMLVFGYAWFAIWTTVSGLAWYSNHVLFIFSRVLAGIGPAICLPNGLAMLGALYEPGKKKNMAFAVFGGCAPTGAITGFAIAGLWNLLWWPCKVIHCSAPKGSYADLSSGCFWFTGIVLFVTAATAYFAVRLHVPDTCQWTFTDLFSS